MTGETGTLPSKALGGVESTIVKQASDELRRLSVMFSGILRIAPVLDQVVSLQQAAEESEGRVKVAREQEEVLKASIAKQNAEMLNLSDRIAAAKKQSDSAEKAAAETVSGQVRIMIETANREAEKIKADAAQNATSLIANARQEAKDAMDKIALELEAKKKELAAITSELNAAKVDLAAANKSWEEFRAKVTK